MPLTNPIGEPLIEELESLIPGLAPTKPALLPGIKTSKPFLYQTPGESENSEQPNLIETASQPKDEFSPAKADALIINKASAFNSIPSTQTSDPKTNSYSRDSTTSEIDPLIGKLDSDLGDPLTNPNRITSPVITTSTTSEKASDQTPLPATAETSSKPEDQKTPLSSEATLKSESEPNKTAPATASTVIPEHSTTSSDKSDKIAVTNSTETIAASPNIPSTDKTSTDKQSPVAKADDKIDSAKQSQNSTIVEKANSDEQSRTAEVSDKIDSDKKAPIAPTSETKNSDKQLPVAEASTLIDSDKKSPTVDAIPTEKPTSNSQLPPTTQPPTAPLIRATSNPVSPDTNISAEVKSTDSKNPVQTATQPLTDKQNDSQKVDPLKTEPAAIPKTAASENVAVTTATAAVQIPEKSPKNTDSVSEIKQPVKTESIVSQSADAELIKTEKTATPRISQPPAETKSIIAPIPEQSPAKIESLVSNVREPSPKETNSNVSTAAEQLPTKNESIIPTAINFGTLENEIAFPEITSELESELPTKTDSLATVEFTADTIERDIVVSFTAAELETEKTLPVAVDSLEPEPLISNSNYSVKTEQRTGDFQSNTNSPTNLSITAAANSPSGTFLVDNQGKVKFDYVFDGGYFQGEVGIFSLAGMSAFTPGTPEFIAEASRRVLSNSTDGHIVISDSTEGAKFTGAMPFDGDWGSGEYQGIKTFSMLPGDTFAVMLVPNATIQSSLQS